MVNRTEKIDGRHQQNIHRIIWNNVKLIDGIDESFTIIADGTETTSDYFACLIVYDSSGNDCFKEEHPYREKLTELLADKMNKIGKDPSVYRLFG